MKIQCEEFILKNSRYGTDGCLDRIKWWRDVFSYPTGVCDVFLQKNVNSYYLGVLATNTPMVDSSGLIPAGLLIQYLTLCTRASMFRSVGLSETLFSQAITGLERLNSIQFG
jgi:hypothetical protein